MDKASAYRPLRRFWAVVLLLLLLYNSAGQAVVFTALRYTVRLEVKAFLKRGVPESELIVLSIPQPEEHNRAVFQRIHEGEFRYKGSLYDIVRKDIRGSTTVYYCINDTAEEQLFANLDERVRTALPSSSAAQSTSPIAALKLVIKEALIPASPIHFIPCYRRPFAGAFVCRAYTITLDIPTPPPRIHSLQIS